MRPFDYYVPKDHAEASKLLASGNGTASVRAMQGGTDLLIRIRAGAIRPEAVVDLKHLPGLTEIRNGADGWLLMGAACTMNQVAGHPEVRKRSAALVQACNSVASYQLRNRATVGGNCCNASPAADTVPALLCLGAEAEIYGPSGTRRVPIGDFLTGPGRTALRPGEFLTGILLPPAQANAAGAFQKLGRTRLGDISIVSVVVSASAVEGSTRSGSHKKVHCVYEWRVAMGAVGPTPLRSPEAESAFRADTSPEGIAAAAELAAQSAKPIDDIRASASYRRAMVRVLVRRCAEAVLSQLAQESTLCMGVR